MESKKINEEFKKDKSKVFFELNEKKYLITGLYVLNNDGVFLG